MSTAVDKSDIQSDDSLRSKRIRLLCLFLLSFQNSILILAMKYNAKATASDGFKSMSTMVIVWVRSDCSSLPQDVSWLFTILSDCHLHLSFCIISRWNS